MGVTTDCISAISRMYEYTSRCVAATTTVYLRYKRYLCVHCPFLTVNFVNDRRDICPMNLITKYLNNVLNIIFNNIINRLSISTFHIFDNNSSIPKLSHFLNFVPTLTYIHLVRCFVHVFSLYVYRLNAKRRSLINKQHKLIVTIKLLLSIFNPIFPKLIELDAK